MADYMKELKGLLAAVLYVLATIVVVALKPVLIVAQKASEACGKLAQKKLVALKEPSDAT